MAKWFLDPYQKAAVPFGLLGCSAPRTHAGSKRRTRGRHWFPLDADTLNGPPVHEKAQHFSREFVSGTETQNGRSLRTSRRHTHCCKMAPLEHMVTQHASLAWRWEKDFELSYGRSTRDVGENAINVGWKATTQSRPEWKALEQSL